MSVPTNNHVNCITTYQEYDIYHPVSGMMPSMSIGIDGIFHSRAESQVYINAT